MLRGILAETGYPAAAESPYLHRFVCAGPGSLEVIVFDFVSQFITAGLVGKNRPTAAAIYLLKSPTIEMTDRPMRKPAFSTHLSVLGVPIVLPIACCIMFLAACDSAGDNGPKPIKGLLVVSARANIFAAGATEVPDLVGGGGLVPELIRLEGATYASFPTVTDSVTPNIQLYDFSGPEGHGEGETRMSSYRGISGLLHRERFMFLAGVFLSDTAPTPPAPDSLDLTGMGNLDEVKNVGIGQVFYIGDGHSASGKVQHFIVPAGATRLFLGFADHDMGVLVPGYYDDNKGGIGVHYELHKGE